MSDHFEIAGRRLNSRLFIGTAGYPNRQVMLDAITASGAEVVTLARAIQESVYGRFGIRLEPEPIIV